MLLLGTIAGMAQECAIEPQAMQETAPWAAMAQSATDPCEQIGYLLRIEYWTLGVVKECAEPTMEIDLQNLQAKISNDSQSYVDQDCGAAPVFPERPLDQQNVASAPSAPPEPPSTPEPNPQPPPTPPPAPPLPGPQPGPNTQLQQFANTVCAQGDPQSSDCANQAAQLATQSNFTAAQSTFSALNAAPNIQPLPQSQIPSSCGFFTRPLEDEGNMRINRYANDAYVCFKGEGYSCDDDQWVDKGVCLQRPDDPNADATDLEQSHFNTSVYESDPGN